METVIESIKQLSVHSPILPLIVCIFLAIKGRISPNVKLISALVLVSFLSDYISIFLAKTFQNNMPWFHIYVVIESLLLLGFFKQISRHRRLIRIVGIYLLAFILIDILFIEDLFTFNTIARLVQSSTFIFICLIVFHEIFKFEDFLFIEKNGYFWITVGVFLYFTGAFFSFLIYRNLQNLDTPVSQNTTWIYHNIANILKNAFFTIGIWIARKP